MQGEHGGKLSKVKSSSSEKTAEAQLSTEGTAAVKLDVPFVSRLRFAFTGRLNVSYLHEWSSVTTITSTDMSQFEEVKSQLVSFGDVELRDIRNSLTFLRLAASFSKILRNSGDYNVKEISTLLEGLEGYDVYDIGESRYARFNQEAYLSNYKRQDAVLSCLDHYCVKVGAFDKADFDFVKNVENMQSLFDMGDYSRKTLEEEFDLGYTQSGTLIDCAFAASENDLIELYDVVCAYISEAK